MSLVGNIAGKGFLPVPWLTLACSSVTTGVPPRVCRVAIFWEAPGESMAGNTRKLFRTSGPSTQRSRSYCPFTEPTLQPNTCAVRSCQRGQRRFFREGRGQDYRLPILAIPHPLDARIDASRLDVFVPSGRVHAGKWMRTSRISPPSLMVENTNVS